MKKKKLKARRMWANYYPDGDIVLHGLEPIAASSAGKNANYRAMPVAVIPLDDVDGLIAMASEPLPANYITYFGKEREEVMHAALVAIGVLPKQRKGRK